MMQELQEGAVHSVLDGIHHLGFSQNCFPLLLYARAQKFWLKGHLCQRTQYLVNTQIIQALYYASNS